MAEELTWITNAVRESALEGGSGCVMSRSTAVNIMNQKTEFLTRYVNEEILFINCQL